MERSRGWPLPLLIRRAPTFRGPDRSPPRPSQSRGSVGTDGDRGGGPPPVDREPLDPARFSPSRVRVPHRCRRAHPAGAARDPRVRASGPPGVLRSVPVRHRPGIRDALGPALRLSRRVAPGPASPLRGVAGTRIRRPERPDLRRHRPGARRHPGPPRTAGGRSSRTLTRLARCRVGRRSADFGRFRSCGDPNEASLRRRSRWHDERNMREDDSGIEARVGLHGSPPVAEPL